MRKLIEIVAVRDSAVDAFARPIFVPSIATAVRSFTDEVNRAAADNQMYLHSDDFTMYHIGQWDEDSGLFISVDHRVICRGKDVRGHGEVEPGLRRVS